jgi:hypothetical protein
VKAIHSQITPHSRFGERVQRLCAGDPHKILPWLEEKSLAWPCFCCGLIILGCGLYGASLGAWRDPLQGLYAGIKFPLVIFLTVFVNALLNGAFAQLLGIKLSIKQTAIVILKSFTIIGLILGSFAPVSFYILWHLPELGSEAGFKTYSWLMLGNVGLISYAGIMANIRLYRLVREISGDTKNSLKILIFWLVGGLFVGSQFSWILRPFIGSPLMEVEFLRGEAFESNFYEAIFRSLSNLLTD